jgi:hypothetical protein
VKIKSIFNFFFFFLALLISCKRNKTQPLVNHPVPSVPVNVTIYPNDPLNFRIQAIGGWIYFNAGINGIIIYRKSNEEFIALERTSPHLPNDTAARVYVTKDNFSLLDTVSRSRWQIIDGAIIKEPTQWPLRLYGTSFNGNVLRIIN